MSARFNRREFIQATALTGASLALTNSLKAFAPPAKEKVRIGIIGSGFRSQEHIGNFCQRPDVEVIALADPQERSINEANAEIRKYGRPEPVAYKNGDYDYRNLLKRDDIDAVVICSPWEWHSLQAVDAMNAGKIPGMEVCGAVKLQECWDVVYTSEKTKIPVMMMENVCYRRDIMAVMNMVRKGMFGELLHVQGGYEHDLRGVLFNDGKTPYDSGVEFGKNAYSEAQWRTGHHLKRNGELYPTHGLGPVAVMLDINKGNRLTKLSSIATKSRGLNRYIAKHPKGGKDHPNAKLNFKLGDVVTTQIQTANGETIILTHDTSSPRPYNLGFRVQGTNGIWMDNHAGQLHAGLIHFEDKSKSHTWENPEKYMKEHDHPLWMKYGTTAEGSGHGGMDFFVDHAFIECIKRGLDFPMDVYDYATWYSITPLSEKSIAEGGQVQSIPDFTRGKWKSRKQDFALSDDY